MTLELKNLSIKSVRFPRSINYQFDLILSASFGSYHDDFRLYVALP